MSRPRTIYVSGVKVWTAEQLANLGQALRLTFNLRRLTKVSGNEVPVLFQVFERRVLTYNPANDDAFKVEMGNVGQHYYEWRYPSAKPTAQPTETTTTQPTAAPTANPTSPSYPAP